jgi:hypothetical protein
VEYLGKLLACEHCHGRFQAADPDSRSVSTDLPSAKFMERVDELLSSVNPPPAQPR